MIEEAFTFFYTAQGEPTKWIRLCIRYSGKFQLSQRPKKGTAPQGQSVAIVEGIIFHCFLHWSTVAIHLLTNDTTTCCYLNIPRNSAASIRTSVSLFPTVDAWHDHGSYHRSTMLNPCSWFGFPVIRLGILRWISCSEYIYDSVKLSKKLYGYGSMAIHIYIYKYHSWGDEPPKIPLDFVETFGIQWMTHHKSSSDRSLAGKAFQSAQLPTGVLFFMNLDIQVIYRWYTGDIQVIYRWYTGDIQVIYP
jgi:hypothetical protein